MTPSGRETAGGRVVLLMLLVLVLLVGGGYAAAAVAAGDNVPRGTTIAGVDVGGRTPAEAAEALEAGLADRVDEPIPVSVDGETPHRHPGGRRASSVDYAASVAAAGGEKSWEPGRLWDYYTGGDDLDAVVIGRRGRDDGDRRGPGRVGRHAAEGRRRPLRGRRGQGDPAARRASRSSVDDARAALEAAYLQEGETAELSLTPAQPDIDDADVQAALDEFANPAVSGPVTLVFGKSPVRLTAARVRAGARHARRGRRAGARARRGEAGDAGRGRREPQRRPRWTRRFRVVDGKPKVVPDKPGRPLPAGGRQRRLPRPRAAAQREARAEGQGDRRGGRLHDPGRPRPEDHRAGVDVHDVLPLRGVPQRQHRPRRRAGQRHRARAR